MLKLLKKEFALCANPLSLLFLLFAAMVFIPSYPTLVGGFFVTLGIFYSFQNLGESNDILYTALLPIRKVDTVKAKFLFVLLLQIAAFLLFFAAVLVRMFLLSGSDVYAQSALMPPNFAFLGFLLVLFGLYLILFLGGFFKTAYRVGKPFLVYCIVGFIFISLVEVLYHIPGLEGIGAGVGENLTLSLLILAFGVVFYGVAFLLSFQKACRNFESIDL